MEPNRAAIAPSGASDLETLSDLGVCVSLARAVIICLASTHDVVGSRTSAAVAPPALTECWALGEAAQGGAGVPIATRRSLRSRRRLSVPFLWRAAQLTLTGG